MTRAPLVAIVVASALTALGAPAIPAGASAPALAFPSSPDPCNIPPNSGVSPQHWMAALGLPLQVSGTALPQTVVAVEANGAPNLAVVNATLTTCGLPAINPTIVNDPVNPPSAANSGEGEANLDLAILGAAMPPNANLVLVNSGGTLMELFALAAEQCDVTINTQPTPGSTSPAVARGPGFPAGGCILSVSYGYPEQSTTSVVNGQTVLSSTSALASDLLNSLADIGVVVVVAAGDSGSGGCTGPGVFTSTILTPSFPASDPSVLAVGGTQWASQAATTGAYSAAYVVDGDYTPNVWRTAVAQSPSGHCPNFTLNGQPANGLAGGGGISAVFLAPVAAAASANAANYPALPANRMVPDVAALAGWPGYALMTIAPVTGTPAWPIGFELGTSAAAPSVASGIANVNAVRTAKGLSPITNGGGPLDVHSVFYNKAYAAAMTDITLGNNNLMGLTMNGVPGWSALPGFDMASGMGTPNFATLATLMVAMGGRATPDKPAAPKRHSTDLLLGGGVRMDTGTPSTPPQKVLVRRPSTSAADAPVGKTKTILWVEPSTRLSPSTVYAASIRIRGTWVPLGKTTSSTSGAVALPPLRFDRAGRYPLRLATPGSPDRYITLSVTSRP